MSHFVISQEVRDAEASLKAKPAGNYTQESCLFAWRRGATPSVNAG